MTIKINTLEKNRVATNYQSQLIIAKIQKVLCFNNLLAKMRLRYFVIYMLLPLPLLV